MDNSQATLERNTEKIKKKEERNEIEKILNKYGWQEEHYYRFVSKKVPRIRIEIWENHLEFLDQDEKLFFTDSVVEIESILKFINYMADEYGISGNEIRKDTYEFMARRMFRD
ncbi:MULTISPECIES: hypothetical protein [Leptospira]|uniref:hypothetical protein n=1 Tax=Leptospira TaxID=171 RepID=UPI0010915418|nr:MULTISPECIES: hypothetical protein [Leptospira]MCG6195632.1 hypothetical protein [Leptospira sanjuanensis]TGM99715.1 hypothetical protein EHR10_08985 [Leptospira yasudae]